MSSLAIDFRGKNEAAQAAVDTYVRRYRWRISQETRDAINSIVERSIQEGIAPYDAAVLIKAVIGLNSPQANAVMNYREELVDSGLSAENIDRQVSKYADRLLDSRSETIARTEIMGALNSGRQSEADDARAAGLLTNPVKTWQLTPDDLLCPLCEEMEGETVPIDAPFSSGVDFPPLHPNCRCSVAFTEG